uniref:Phospholipid scramblase n=1 Tax=Romanomermis culicivorax TaxID=13658 RepID=A0A915L846_ROMCU
MHPGQAVSMERPINPMMPPMGQMSPMGMPYGGQMAPMGVAPYGIMGGPYGGQPIMQQPGSAMMMGGGLMVMDVNTLLAPLIGADKVVVRQNVEMAEVFTGIETSNRYMIYNGAGQILYYAYEDTDFATMQYCGTRRRFRIHVMDAFRRRIIVVSADVLCCTRDVMVEVPAGRIAAQIHQECAICKPSFYIRDAAQGYLFKDPTIVSPVAAVCGTFGDANFNVYSSDQSTIVGQISKKWGGLFREMFTDADIFGVSFPPDMDPTWKAVLIGATFVIDFAFYESDPECAEK